MLFKAPEPHLVTEAHGDLCGGAFDVAYAIFGANFIVTSWLYETDQNDSRFAMSRHENKVSSARFPLPRIGI